jgi:hypothetical protein
MTSVHEIAVLTLVARNDRKKRQGTFYELSSLPPFSMLFETALLLHSSQGHGGIIFSGSFDSSQILESKIYRS